jgi:macrolide transport system ATP-binding/permease protein
LLESFLADVRFSLRWLRKSPGFTLVAVASLAIGIGFNTALFTIADALLFKPLPVAAPDRLVDIFTSAPGFGPFSTSSYPDYLDLRAQNEVFEDIAGYSPMFAALNLDNRSRLAMGEIVTGNYFQLLGVVAALGRTLLPDDDRAGAERVAMVSHRYWRRELASARDAVGRAVRIRGNTYTIVGVAPAGFNGMVPILAPELWIPAVASLEVEPVGMHDTVPSTGTTRLERRGDRWMFLRARLKPGKSVEEARANLTLLMARIDEANPGTNKGRLLSVRPTNDIHFHPAADSTVVPIAAGLFTVVGLVLLIACANVASMLLARSSARQKEIAVRLAVGASRGRLVRQLVTEAVVISMLGAVAGTLLAWWVTAMAASVQFPIAIPLAFDLRIDARVLLFTLAATGLAGVLAGLAPALQASRPNLVADLRGEQAVSRVGGRGWTLRDALVVCQMAITAMLLVTAALLTRSLVAAQRTNVGLPVKRLAVVSTDTAMLRYPESRSQAFYDQAVERLKTIPGVESVALATRVPFSVNYNRWEVWVPGRHQPGEHGDGVEMTTVSPDYFATIGVPILEGRPFSNDDKPDTTRVAIVNETFARRYWPGQSAVGRTFRSRVSDGVEFQVVGVSADHKVVSVREPPTPFLQVARTQRPSSYTTIIARTRGDASALLRDMRRELLALEPNLVFVENQTMEAEVGATLFAARAGALLMTIAGAMAMLLAAIGLYGVIAYSVARRTKEIGIRLALGARPAGVLTLIMRQGLVVAVAGLALGCLLAAIVGATTGSVLYGVRASDPVSWLAASAVLLVVSVLANIVPAWRASKVEPSQALRID